MHNENSRGKWKILGTRAERRNFSALFAESTKVQRACERKIHPYPAVCAPEAQFLAAGD